MFTQKRGKFSSLVQGVYKVCIVIPTKMVRTRADNTARKAVAAKAPRKILGASSAGASCSSAGLSSPSGKYAGGNAVCPRPTPDWQKGISGFFVKSPKSDKENEEPMEDDAGACSSAKDCESSGSLSSPAKESQGSSSSGSGSKSTKRNGLIDSDSDDE